MSTLKEKIIISASSAFLYMIVNLPQTYKLVNGVIPFNTYNESINCPTHTGLLLHAIVFFVLTFLTMGNPAKKTGIKLKHSLYGTLIFFLISSPAMFAIVGKLLGNQFADQNGCPTIQGIFLHGIVYFIALVAVMYLPNEDK